VRLRTFTAPTAAEAMSLARRELGPDAIILSTQEAAGGGTTLTAAIDTAEPALAIGSATDCIDLVHEALSAHGIPTRLAEKLLAATWNAESGDATGALSGALGAVFSFAPLATNGKAERVMLVGSPGAGKTISIAKLAARAVFERRPARVISCDTVRAGGIEQLEAFTRLLELPLHRAESEQQVRELAAKPKRKELVLIDTAGINPYRAADRAELAGLIAAAKAEPVFVLPAGGDLLDTIEVAGIFRELGCRRVLVTRVDTVRRLGSVLAAADMAKLAFSEISITPSVAEGLTSLGPDALARLLLPEPTATRHLQTERVPS
jgi:flagellar biosynthesis protein FlhF